MPPPKILLTGDRRLTAFPAEPGEPEGSLVVVGWREWAGLPGLGIARVKAKIDTGARTSALHANSIETFERGRTTLVRFDVTGEAETVPWHESPVADRRLIRSSNGETELRFVIRTELWLAGRTWPVEISLTNRERMDLPMLIGREALAGRALVDADKSWLWGRPLWRTKSALRPASSRRLRRVRLGDRR
jgi:hypothetical protein